MKKIRLKRLLLDIEPVPPVNRRSLTDEEVEKYKKPIRKTYDKMEMIRKYGKR